MVKEKRLWGTVLVASILLIGSAALADDWVTQEDADFADYSGCWSVFPTNYVCDGFPHLVDGDYETCSVSYLQNQEAVLHLSYEVPLGAELARWVVHFQDSSADPTSQEYIIDLVGHSDPTLEMRINVTNTGTIGSPYSFEVMQNQQWLTLHSGNTGSPYVSAIIYEERVDWFGESIVAEEPVSWGNVKATYR